MGSHLNETRKYLLAVNNSETQDEWAEAISQHVSKGQFYRARDGAEAQAKINNDPPDVVIADLRLPKVSGLKLTQSLLENAKLKNVAVILISKIPDEEHFVDEVVTGRVQFLESFDEDHKLSQCLSRALNYVSRNTDEEFHLRFLSPGDVLINEGEKADHVYIVKKGQLKASTEKDGESTTLGPVDSGEFVGEMAYINGEPRNATVTAMSDCELIEIPIQIMDKVLFHKPAWSKALMKTLSKRVKASNTKE